MSSAGDQIDLAEPHMRENLAMAGLDVEYVRAEGNTLYFLDENGEEVPVVDYAGGYGALLLGHNNPEITAHAIALLNDRTPVLAQFSRHAAAIRTAARLDEIMRRELGSEERFYSVFANTGAEAVEAALKHAELGRATRISALTGEISASVEAARAAVDGGKASLPEEFKRFDDLAGHVTRHNAEVLTRPPLFLALEGSFHGKLASSVQLTHNGEFRTPFAALAAQAVFVPFNQPGALTKIIERERASLLDLVVDGGAVRVRERDLPVFGAFVVEPIQGEGGINEMSAEFAAEIRRVCDAIGCPVVVDEIQSGMGRTGAFLASSSIGLRGDYYTLAKSLGGGLAKVSVLLVRDSCYLKEFELVHSSTFAKDGFSSAVALKVLELLEADDGRVYRLAAERGERLKDMLRSLAADFPDVVKDVRGRGLMLGLELHDQSDSQAALLRDFARAHILGYVISGYLLRRHRVRTFPTASAVNTLRFAPSAGLTDAEIAQLEAGLRDLCSIIRAQDEQALFA
ncbi:aminotransferase class III-fold pyridoxal phosphate-dependent enzyme [Streptosporangium sp. NPDC023615]|uniref:aspartate aminotransferase family protein n=1 Tax=Streptosporangium sp. NPDC023615 TaxID=3154794 RepID=UPI003414CB76